MRIIETTLLAFLGREQAMKGKSMLTAKSQLAYDAVAAMVLIFVLGSLSMIWPSIIALSFGLFLLLQSLGFGQEITMLSLAEVNNLPIALASFRRSDPPSILS
jgi:hypothetical protein